MELTNIIKDFKDVIGIVFNNWTGLKLAVEHGSGGTPAETRNKIENLIKSINEILINKGDYYDLIDELETVLDEQFCTIVEDNSCEEVSNELINLFNLYSVNNTVDTFNRLDSFKIKESILIPLGINNVNNVRVEDKELSDEEMPEDSEWTVVTRKKR